MTKTRVKGLLVVAMIALSAFALPANAADIMLPTSVEQVAGSPIRIDGCTAQQTDSAGGYLDDYYIRGNASFTNLSSQPATEVDILIHYRGAYGNHDAMLIKRGSFAPGIRIDPKRRAWVAMLQPEAMNIDTDGSTEIDIWGTVSAECAPVAARFADGTVWTFLIKPPTSAQSPSSPHPPPKYNL